MPHPRDCLPFPHTTDALNHGAANRLTSATETGYHWHGRPIGSDDEDLAQKARESWDELFVRFFQLNALSIKGSLDGSTDDEIRCQDTL